jgi:hypothetical protein
MRTKTQPALPVPDQFSNFWLEEKPLGPVIFHGSSSYDLGYDCLRDPQRWFLSFGGDRGVLFDEKKKIRYFTAPQEALRYYLEHV